jgi:23S rRNA (cytosine1962-C5)-methyltransferase
MKRLKPGGILITCSCSQAVNEAEFGQAILTAARNARMQFQVLEKRGAPQDHPVLLGLPETDYLKCFVMKRIE